MSDPRWQRVREVFESALECQPDEREAFVRTCCGDDADLVAEVCAMLEAEAGSDGFLHPPLTNAAFRFLADDPDQRMIGQRVGAYELVELIASGGMGSVYRAVRADAEFDQQVAIKLIRPGMGSREVLHRFLRERQTLARLQHPNIARLLDGGATGDGSPYFVMEYVDGTPITRYCDERRLTIDERLSLYLKVCAAVQHAHRNLIVHRDLKPVNILVTTGAGDADAPLAGGPAESPRAGSRAERAAGSGAGSTGSDGIGEPKLLDFGISKLLDDTADASMTVTVTALRFLTPRYASPEQVLGEPVTTSSDVYALGVILYELLCGRAPYDLSGGTSQRVRELVCETEPSRPSETAVREPAATAELRRTTRQRLQRKLAGDVDTIVLTAMQKSPERRYASAERLAEDIRLYLDGLPILARPDSWWYRTTKFVRRNRLRVAGAAVLALALLGGGIGTTIGWTRAYDAAQRADDAGRRADVVSSFVKRIIDATHPHRNKGAVAISDLIDFTAEIVDETLAGEPRVAASVHHELGRIYLERADYDSARAEFDAVLAAEHALGAHDALILLALNSVGELDWTVGRLKEAEAPLRTAIARREEAGLGQTFPMADAYGELGGALVEVGRFDEGIETLRQGLRVAEALNDPTLLYHNLGRRLVQLGRIDEAEPLLTDAARLWSLQPDAGEGVAANASRRFLGVIARLRGDFDQAEQTLQRVLTVYRLRLGPDHPWSAYALYELGRVYMDQGRAAEARAALDEALAIQRNKYPPGHFRIARTLAALGVLDLADGDVETAEARWLEALSIREAVLLPDHPELADSRALLARCRVRQRRCDEARALLEQANPVLLSSTYPVIVTDAEVERDLARLQAGRGGCD